MNYLISTPLQLSHALRDVRKSRGLSQDSTGKLVGLLPKTISALENHPDSATIDSLLKLLSALELHISHKNKIENNDSLSSITHGDW